MPLPRGRWKTACRTGMPWRVRKNDDRPAQEASAPIAFGLILVRRRVDRFACLLALGLI